MFEFLIKFMTRVLAPKPPDDECQNNTDDDGSGEWEVEGETLALDQDIAREAAEAEFADHRPEQADEQNNQADGNERLLHNPVSAAPIKRR